MKEEKMDKFKLVEIEILEEHNYDGKTYDLEVEDDHSYNIEGIIVHNSVCTTRVKTGVGYPQLSAVMECADAAHGVGGFVCADGGCNVPGDIAKAFGAGADFVMAGGMFAGHDECSGEVVEHYKTSYEGFGAPMTKSMKFYGMSSEEAQEAHGGSLKDYRASEGKCIEVPYRGPVANTLQDMLGGLRSACTYIGARRLKDLPKCTTFVRCTQQENQVFSDK